MTQKGELKLFSTSGQSFRGLEGVWKNELDSEMTVTQVNADGSFSGHYKSIVSENGQEVIGKVTGYVAVDTIAWSVNWQPTYNSVTSWAGKILKDPAEDPVLYTLWHLSHGVTDAKDWWQSFISGSDRFWRLGP